MTLRIGINGFGRIGRLVLRASLGGAGVEVVAINDLLPLEDLAHLLSFDSVYGRFQGEVGVAEGGLTVDGRFIPVTGERDPSQIGWGRSDVDTVVESTGFFRSREKASLHLKGGARRVIVSAPGTGLDRTFVMGVNDHEFQPHNDFVVSNASCTTNCLAPVAKVLHENYVIEEGLMTTIHAYTAGQNLVDGPNKDQRRARAAALNIVPTTTGAAKAIALVLPQLEGKIDGMALRVPTPTVSLVDLTVLVKNPPQCAEEVNSVLSEASEGSLAGIMGVEHRPLVSKDYEGDGRSSIVDGRSTAVKGELVKVLAWYDNEFGYASRVVDLARHMG